MKLPLYQIDAFAEALFQGNPAAVCPLPAWLEDDVLQAIAEENNLAETAFYVAEGEGFHLRWFTPVTEVDLCGHATLAAAYVVFQRGESSGSEVTFHSRSGALRVAKTGDQLTLDFPKLHLTSGPTPAALTEAFGLAPREYFRGVDHVAVFASEQQIRDLTPDFRLLQKLDLRGVIATAPGDDCDFVSRFFAPNFGIDEDPVTGSAHCALAPFWADRLGRNDLSARQLSPRTGRLDCSVRGDRVHISGRAIGYLEGTIQIGPDDGAC